MSLYESIAEQLETMIENRSLRFGDKLPSVRSFSKSRGVSANTILEAYRLLESKQLVEARPRSGYFVALRPDAVNHTMQSDRWMTPGRTSVSDTMPQILREAGQPEILNLGAANPDHEILPVAAMARITREILRTRTDSLTSYDDPQGNYALRRRIVDLMLERGAAVSADDVLITTGCQQALYLALERFRGSDTIVAVESPTYPGALQVLDRLGIHSIEIPSSSRHGFSVDRLREALQEHAVSACYVMPRCSNPLGASMSEADLGALYELACEFDLTLIEDDTNWGLSFADTHTPALKSLDTDRRVIYCASFSKVLAPALRVGWIVEERSGDDLLYRKYMQDMGCAALPQLVVAKYLSERRFAKDLTKIRNAHGDAVHAMVAAIRAHFPAGTVPIVPSGGFTVWTELPASVDSRELREIALRRGISIAPGTTFSGRGSFRNFVRLGWGGEWNARIEEKVRELGGICRTLL